MKIRKKYKIFVLILVLFSFSIASVASAQTYSNAYITAVGAGVTSGGNGIVYVDFNILARDTMDKVGVSVILLYTTEDDTIGNSDDNLVKTFLYTNILYTEQMMATDNYVHVSYVEYQGVEGQKYYAELSFYAEKDGGFGTMHYTTRITTA